MTTRTTVSIIAGTTRPAWGVEWLDTSPGSNGYADLSDATGFTLEVFPVSDQGVYGAVVVTQTTGITGKVGSSSVPSVEILPGAGIGLLVPGRYRCEVTCTQDSGERKTQFWLEVSAEGSLYPGYDSALDEPVITRTIKKGVAFQHLIVVRSRYTHWPQIPSRARAAILLNPGSGYAFHFEADVVWPERGVMLSLTTERTLELPVGVYPFDVVIDIDSIGWTDYLIKTGYVRVTEYTSISSLDEAP